ncbi:patatin-like phospholipase family protein [Kitasatospora sp. LaBMicrA B282]|uniref:patatin-like phospholipase family protein n=1 Tax=Kitasatospora sp. LaBMicrA B282 TaxID=3420949 RepID=UPI003D0C0CDD
MYTDTDSQAPAPAGRTAFVLGGGGNLGGYEAGMLRALFEAGVRPDLVVGTSVGSIQGAIAAAHPGADALTVLDRLWSEFVAKKVMHTSALGAISSIAHHHNHVASNEHLRELLADIVGEDTRIEDLKVPFQCVAACIERASARYFDSGPLVPALLASCAVPGLWPPVEIDGEHHYDGGLVESIPVHRALALGAETVYVLHVGRIEHQLTVPRSLWEVASVSFEISRRHGFADAIAEAPPGVTLHVLPSGEDPHTPQHRKHHLSAAAELDEIRRRVESGYQATRAYLAEHVPTATVPAPTPATVTAEA